MRLFAYHEKGIFNPKKTINNHKISLRIKKQVDWNNQPA